MERQIFCLTIAKTHAKVVIVHEIAKFFEKRIKMRVPLRGFILIYGKSGGLSTPDG